MRGKKPKERQRYVLRVNETLVEVTRDVYLAWYQSRRKERYQLEKMQKNGVCGIEKVGETSYNSYLHILSPEEIVIRVSEIQELQEALKYLSEEEMELIRLLFFEEYTVKNSTVFRVLYKDNQKQEKQSIAETKRQAGNFVSFCCFKKFSKKISNRLIFALSHMRLVEGQMSILIQNNKFPPKSEP